MSIRSRVLPAGRLAFFVVLTACCAADAHAALIPGAVNARSMEFQGYERLYDIWVPAGYDGSTPVPLVIDIHGYGSSKSAQRGVSGMDDQANLHGFLVAYPQGLFGQATNPEASNLPAGPSWNASNFCCGSAVSEHIDDVGFLKAMAASIESEANIDVRRVYATGLSNGGAMSHKLACLSADQFAAAAPMAFPLGIVPMSDCQPSRPIPVRHYAGLTDSLVPYNGGPVFPSAATSFAYWRDVDSCVGATPDETVVHGSSKCETYTDCADGTQVGLCSILASAATPRPGHILYINSDLDLAEDAWSFLSQFQAPAPICGDGVVGAGEQCDDGNVDSGDGCDASCDPEPCSAAPATECRGTLGKASRLRLKDETDDTADQFQWKWNKGMATARNEFGNPRLDQELWMCLYADGALRSSTLVEPGGLCDGEACWKDGSRGFEYRDEAGASGGVTQVSLREGVLGKARIRVKGEGAGLEMPGTMTGDVVIQLKKPGSDVCWESYFRESNIKQSDTRFSAVGD